jgi:hypothetical protein
VSSLWGYVLLLSCVCAWTALVLVSTRIRLGFLLRTHAWLHPRVPFALATTPTPPPTPPHPQPSLLWPRRYIVTPVSASTLRGVNVLVRGNLGLPALAFTQVGPDLTRRLLHTLARPRVVSDTLVFATTNINTNTTLSGASPYGTALPLV